MLKEEILKDNPNIIESFDEDLKRAFDVIDNDVPKEFKDASRVRLNRDKFRLSGDGVFYTIQGEGMTMGLPTVFVRLHVCNLRCVWCDAYYTWNPNSKEFWTESYELTVDETIKRIEETWKPKTTIRVVFTGGEPLLQKALIDEVILKRPNWKYEIETNGTVMPTELQLTKCQFNCSPKLRNSKNYDVARIKGDVLEALNKVNTQFKFVVMTDEDLEEIEVDFVKPFNLEHEKIVIMPQGVTSGEVWANAKNVVELAKTKGYRLMGRLHVDIWGARRKV